MHSKVQQFGKGQETAEISSYKSDLLALQPIQRKFCRLKQSLAQGVA